MHLFPGGAVDDDDQSLDVDCLHADCLDSDGNPGPFAQQVSARLGVSAGGLGYLIAAARECFEEAGIFLGSIGSPLSRPEQRALRNSVDIGDVSFAHACRTLQATVAAHELRYLSRWITPVGAVRRYDTRFFVAVAPPDQDADEDGAEAVALQWVAPAAALGRHRAGDLAMLTPTSKTLEALSAARSTAELLAHLPTW